MAGSITNTVAEVASNIRFDRLYPCSFSFNVEVNEYTENHEPKIDVVCKSLPVCGEDVTHAIESIFSNVIEDTTQTNDDTKVSTRFFDIYHFDEDGVPFVIEKMYYNHSSYKTYELGFKYTFSTVPESEKFYGRNHRSFLVSEFFNKDCAFVMHSIVSDTIKDNPGRFGMDQETAKAKIDGVYEQIYRGISDHGSAQSYYRNIIQCSCWGKIKDLEVYSEGYDFTKKQMLFLSNVIDEEEVRHHGVLNSKFPFLYVPAEESEDNKLIFYYISEESREKQDAPFIERNFNEEQGEYEYMVKLQIKYDILTELPNNKIFENTARALGAEFAYAVSYEFYRNIHACVDTYNHLIDDHNKTVDKRGIKKNKISLDVKSLMRNARSAIKWSLPPGSLLEASARVVATDRHDYGADTEENKRIVPAPLRTYISKIRSMFIEYVS